jgi:hypothetical protein
VAYVFREVIDPHVRPGGLVSTAGNRYLLPLQVSSNRIITRIMSFISLVSWGQKALNEGKSRSPAILLVYFRTIGDYYLLYSGLFVMV